MSPDTELGLVPSVLREYGELTRAALRDYLPAREPRRFLYDLLRDYPNRGGKMMRPSLCLAAARLFGARPEDAVRCAVAIEMLHNALLIHDDIEDESEERRGSPTLHRLHGIPLAINAGDTLTLMMLRPLLETRSVVGESLTLRLVEETERMARECAEGQAMELGWRRHNDLEVTEADYLNMVLKKTCWLATIYPLRIGALVGSRGMANLDPFVRFGFFLGAAFQIQDDLLNLTDDSGRYGKELDGDLWEGKRTLMLLRVLRESTPEDREELSSILRLSRENRTAEQISWTKALILRHDCIEYGRNMAHQMAGAALHEYSLFSAGLPDSRDKTFLEQIVTWVIVRN